jgi:hypothetical protein
MARRGLLYAVAIVVAACGFLALENGPTAAPRARTVNDVISVGSAPNHEATIATPAARITRAHRPTAAGAFLAVAIGAALAAWAVLHPRRSIATRRVEQFYVRRRGPPLHLATV